MLAACTIFLASLVYAVVTGRSLYDDGCYYFVRVLQAGGFTEMLFSRGNAADLFQLPVVIALKLGITSIPKLQMAFGIGCFIAWPLAMGMCYLLAPKQFWLVVLACGAGYLNAAFVAVGEHVVAHAFFWPVCFVLLFVRPMTPMAAGMLLFSAAMLFRSYESMLFIGPVLAWLAFRRAAVEEDKSWSRIVLLVAAILLAGSCFVALDGTLHPCTGSNANSFTTGLYSVLAAPGWTISWTLFWLLLMLGCWVPKFRRFISHPVAIILLGMIVLLWGAWPWLAPAQLNPYKQYEARFLDLVVPLGLLGVALIMVYRPQWLKIPRAYLVNLSAVLLIAQSLWNIAATEQWDGYVKVLKHLMATHTGLLQLTDTPYGKAPAVGRQATRFLWIMDARNFEVVISPPNIKCLILPDPWVDEKHLNGPLISAFEPANLPDLKHYGVDYSEYVKAFQAQTNTFGWRKTK